MSTGIVIIRDPPDGIGLLVNVAVKLASKMALMLLLLLATEFSVITLVTKTGEATSPVVSWSME